jgi:phospholipid-binding lipoprotein MlaA
MRRLVLACALLARLALPGDAAAADDDLYADPEAEPETAAESDADADTHAVNDPWEGMNRRIWAFNEFLDRYALEPIATGWDFVMPTRVETCIDNFFDNLQTPFYFANDLLQGKPWQAYETFWRAILNTTLGVGGLFDPASYYTILKSDEDFGQTLGVWGMPPGPYLVLPFLGPSNPRDTAGLAVEAGAAFPIGWYLIPSYVSVPANAVDIVNRRALALETIREERKAAFDWYAAARNAAISYRENQVRDRAEEPEGASDEDLYEVEE